MNRYLFWIWALISVCWTAFVIVPNWFTKPPEPEYYGFSGEHPRTLSWGDKHPECRDRLAFWPDGTGIEDEDFTPLLATPQNQLTDRQRWARDIWYKVKDCEYAVWGPVAIQEERRRLLVGAFVPPAILFLLGAAIAFVWKHYGEKIIREFLRVPRHIRRGLIRLYLVVAVPWIAWFGYKAYAIPRSRASAILTLLVIPVGALILYTVFLWIVAGFRKRAEDQPDKAGKPPAKS